MKNEELRSRKKINKKYMGLDKYIEQSDKKNKFACSIEIKNKGLEFSKETAQTNSNELAED